MLPNQIHAGPYPTPHVQGIAVDRDNGCIYYSFTTMLLKTDFSGNVLGSVVGLGGHLGCIAIKDGMIYGSLEYKHDSIGKNISNNYFQGQLPTEDAFYIAIFDSKGITEENIVACDNPQVMTTVYLKEVFDDYAAPGHRFGCSGIDGLTFAPTPGQPNSPLSLYVAYGVYGDLERADNDYQVILRYDIRSWDALRQPLSQSSYHRSGPAAPDDKFFLFTGNTRYGIQNLEYDPFTNSILAAVYVGHKPNYPNYPFFMIDLAQAPQTLPLQGHENKEGSCIFLKALGEFDAASNTYGWRFPYGATGIAAMGDGTYYFSHDRKENGFSETTVCKYRWDGVHPFTLDEA